MRGTSGQVYTDNIVILQFKNLDDLCSSVSKKRNTYTIKLGKVLAKPLSVKKIGATWIFDIRKLLWLPFFKFPPPFLLATLVIKDYLFVCLVSQISPRIIDCAVAMSSLMAS